MKFSEFHSLISESDQPVVVDFWASWCVPCKQTKPILEDLAERHSDQVTFLPLNVDVSQEIVKHYKILGVPTLLIFQNGNLQSQVTGAQNRSIYENLFTALIENKEIQIPGKPIDRILRIGSAILIGGIGIYLSNWILLLAAITIGFLGIYDRCPIWAAITSRLRRG
jgi:thioredoxin 1